METVNKAVGQAVDAVTRTIYGNVEDTEHKNQHTKPTEHRQIRDDTTALPSHSEEGSNIPTQGPGHAEYLHKPISTTTNEASYEPPNTQNQTTGSGRPPLKDTAAVGHRRRDSGHAEADGATEIHAKDDIIDTGAHQRYGQENPNDDGIFRSGDYSSFSPDGQLRPMFVGGETNDKETRRSDGRDRVQFDDNKGSTGNLKPSGEPSPERPRQGSAGELPPMDSKNKGGIPHMDFGNKGGIPQGARVGTVQGGTVKDRQHGQDLEDAQKAQSGGFGGTPPMFGKSHAYDSTGTSQVQNQQQKQIQHASKVTPSTTQAPSSSNESHSQTGTLSQPGDQKLKLDQKPEFDQKHEEGHLWVKTSGTAAEGGDFDAAKPGAGKEADRLLEQAGVHRTLDPRANKTREAEGHHQTTTTSGNPANPTHHPDSAASGGRGSHGGLHMPGILHHHDNKKDSRDNHGAGGSKGLTEKIKEKLHRN